MRVAVVLVSVVLLVLGAAGGPPTRAAPPVQSLPAVGASGSAPTLTPHAVAPDLPGVSQDGVSAQGAQRIFTGAGQMGPSALAYTYLGTNLIVSPQSGPFQASVTLNGAGQVVDASLTFEVTGATNPAMCRISRATFQSTRFIIDVAMPGTVEDEVNGASAAVEGTETLFFMGPQTCPPSLVDQDKVYGLHLHAVAPTQLVLCISDGLATNRAGCIANAVGTLTGPPPTPQDLQATGLEVTQAIQDLGAITGTGLNRTQSPGSVPLIAGKPTIVRFHVRGTRDTPTLANATLTGQRGGAPLGTLEPFRTELAVRKTPQRGLHDSFFFLLPASWTQAGELSLTATVSASQLANPGTELDVTNNQLRTTVTFASRGPVLLRLIYMDVKAGATVYQADRTVGPRLYDDLRRLFPTAVVGLTQWEVFANTSPDGGTQVGSTLSRIAAAREESRDPVPWLVVLGQVNPTRNAYRRSDGLAVATDPAALAGARLALDPQFTNNQRCGTRATSDPLYPYPFGVIGGPTSDPYPFFGFDVLLGRVVSPVATDFPTLCANPWVSDYTFKQLYTVLQSQAAQGGRRVRAQGAVQVLVAGGSIAEDGQSATLDYLERITGAAPAVGVGPYRLRLHDIAGGLLQETSFTAEPGLDATPIFGTTVPYVPGTRRVAVYSDALGRELGSVPISAQPPTVSITSRTGGPSLPATGPVTLSWTATDPDNNPLTFRVEYSRDNRASWRLLGDTAAMSFTVDAGQLDGTNGTTTGWLRVVAHDGALTNSAESGPFSVTGKGPTPAISSPSTGSFATPGQMVHLMGSAQDLEDGSLADSQLQWRSSRDGVLGTGSFLSLTGLTTGVHTLTLKATDSYGLVGETSVTLTVTATPPTPAPALDVAPDIMVFTYAPGGANPSPQPFAIRNPGSGAVTWTAQSNAPWLTLSSPGGRGEADVQVGINVTALPVGSVTHQGQIAVAASGVSGTPKLVSVQANANPTVTPTRTNTPLVSPTPTVSRTPILTATATRTPTPAPIAGRSFMLQAGAQPQLTWQGGTETGVLVIRWDAIANVFAFLPPPANPLGFLINSYTDPGPLPGQTYCYVLLVLGSNPPSISDVRGLSDLHCVYPQAATGAPPAAFRVRLDQGPIAYLNWNAVPNATSYELTAVRFDGSLPRSIILQGMATSFAEEHGGLSTCYRLVAKNGATEIGGTQQLCAAPGVAALGGGVASTRALERLTMPLPPLALPGR